MSCSLILYDLSTHCYPYQGSALRYAVNCMHTSIEHNDRVPNARFIDRELRCPSFEEGCADAEASAFTGVEPVVGAVALGPDADVGAVDEGTDGGADEGVDEATGDAVPDGAEDEVADEADDEVADELMDEVVDEAFEALLT